MLVFDASDIVLRSSPRPLKEFLSLIERDDPGTRICKSPCHATGTTRNIEDQLTRTRLQKSLRRRLD